MEGHPLAFARLRRLFVQRGGARTVEVSCDPDFDAWIAPFVMATVNTKIVHRSNAISGNTYGDGFLYDEAMLTGKGMKGRLRAGAVVAGLLTLPM